MSSIPPSLDDRDGKIWMDGELVDWRDAKIHVLSHTLHYGCGAFEGVRAYKTADGGTSIFRLAEHTERLFNSAKILRMKIPFTPEQLNEAQKQVVRENKLESCYLRPLIWIGSEKLGVSPKGNRIHAMVAAWSWGAYLGEEGMRRGIRVKTSSYTRHHVNITMTQAKSVSNYTNSILANMEALDDGYDEALLLDASGFVSEGAGENIFVVKGGVVYTPDLSAGALNGITRNTIHAMVAAWAWGAYLGEEGMKRGIRVKTSSYTRHHVNITMTQAKAVSNYTNSILANMEALDDGYDEALLLDSSGFVSEGAGENIFVIKGGVIYTPDLSAGALNGITRNTVFHICKDLGIEIVQKRITRDEVYIADEAFFTGTAAEVTPIRELDRIEIGAGSRGPITEKIQSAFFDIVNGRNPKYASWLARV